MISPFNFRVIFWITSSPGEWQSQRIRWSRRCCGCLFIRCLVDSAAFCCAVCEKCWAQQRGPAQDRELYKREMDEKCILHSTSHHHHHHHNHNQVHLHIIRNSHNLSINKQEMYFQFHIIFIFTITYICIAMYEAEDDADCWLDFL